MPRLLLLISCHRSEEPRRQTHRRSLRPDLEKAEKKFFKAVEGYKRVMKRKKDKHFGKICQFFDTEKRRCTIYEARPSTCREFPGDDNCGYWDFLAFERETQKDKKFISINLEH